MNVDQDRTSGPHMHFLDMPDKDERVQRPLAMVKDVIQRPVEYRS